MATTPIRVSPDEPNPTHHIRLKGGGKDIGLILIDNQGRPDPYALTRDRLVSTSLKINEGNPKYSDFELPFTPLSQEDWSGGRGQERYEDDVTRFLDSWSINTSFDNKVLLAGQMGLTEGTRNLVYTISGNGVYWQPLLGSRSYLGKRFTATSGLASAGGDGIYLMVKKHGDPSGDLVCRVCHSFDSLNPTNGVQSYTLSPDDVDDFIGEWQRFSLQLTDARTNYTDDPRMGKADISEWSISSGSGSKDTGKKVWGTKSLKVTGTSTYTDIYDATYGTGASPAATFSGQQITLSTYLYVPTGTNLPQLQIYYKTTGDWVSAGSQSASAIYDEWQRVTLTVTLPGSLTDIWIRCSAEINGKDIYLDGWSTVIGADTPYFDGDCGYGYAWSGSQHASTSTRANPADLPITDNFQYSLKIYSSVAGTSKDHWRIGVDANPTSGTTRESSTGAYGTWVNSGIDVYQITEDIANTPDRVWQFWYKGGEYTLYDWDDANPKLYLNGDRGTADSNSGNLGRLNDGTKSWPADKYENCVALLTGGKGSTEDQPWRAITGNDATYLNVSPDWKIEHDTTTEYVILGADDWIDVSGSVLPTGDITDVCVHDGVIYLARGDAAVMRRIKYYTNAGAWAEAYDDEAANKADLLCIVYHSDDTISKIQMWRLIQSTQKVSRGDIPAWETDFTFGTEKQVGDIEDKARKLIQYVDPALGYKILWVIKRGSVWAVKGDIPDMIQLPEMRAAGSENTGRAALVHNLFLYWSMFKGGVERFYQDVVDDVGPNRDRGFEVTRQGTVWDLEGYPGRYFIALNGGSDKFSCILQYNGSGHHEFYRSPVAGQQIRSLHIAPIPGDTPDRLYFTEDNTIKYLPLPSETIDPENDPNYRFTHEGYVISSRLHAGMMDILKLFDSLKVMADGLDEGVCWIEADYKVDTEGGSWTPLPSIFDTSPSQEINFVKKGDEGVTGKYGLIRLRFSTSDSSKSPFLRGALINAISRIPTKFGYVAQAKVESRPKDLNGDPDDYYEDGLKKLEDLDELGDSLAVLELSSILTPFHEKRVFIDAPALRPLYNSQGMLLEGFAALIPITVVYRAETEA